MGVSIKDANLEVVCQDDTDVKPNQGSISLSKPKEEEVESDEKKSTKVVSESDEDDDWKGVEKSTELDEIFRAAAAFVATAAVDRSHKVSNDVELELYGLYKIATAGPCTTPQPSATIVKWNAWQKLGAMPPEDAMEKYITIVSKIFPAWMSSVKRHGGDNEGNNLKGPIRPVFSSFAYEEEPVDELKMEVIHTSTRGELDNLVNHIHSGVLVNQKDSEGCSLVHWTVLLSKNIDVNAQSLMVPEPPDASPRLLSTVNHGSAMAGMVFDKFIAVGAESRLSRTTLRNVEEDMEAMEHGNGENVESEGWKEDMEVDEDDENVIIFPKNTPGFIKYGKEDYKKVRPVSVLNNIVILMSGERYMGVQLLKHLQDKLLRMEMQGKERPNTSYCAKFMAICNDKIIKEKRIVDDYEVMLAGYDGTAPKIYIINNQGLSSYDHQSEEGIPFSGCGGQDVADFIGKAKWYQSDLPPSFVADRFCDALRHACAQHPKDCGGMVRVYIITPKEVMCVKYITEEQVGEVGCVLPDGEDFEYEGYNTDSSWCTE